MDRSLFLSEHRCQGFAILPERWGITLVAEPPLRVEPLSQKRCAMTIHSTLRPALRGKKANLLPGLALQTFALLIVVAYFRLEPVQSSLDRLGAFKEQHGYVFSSLSTALFGGLVPFLFLAFSGKIPPGRLVTHGLFYVGFWLWKGVEVDALYRAQAHWFGDAATPAVIATKTGVDQLIYNPLWAAPNQTLFFLWMDSDFSLTKTRTQLTRRSLIDRSFVVLVSTWIVWIPAVIIIYSLPGALQLPLFNLVLCFWCLLLSFVSKDTSRLSTNEQA
jgi:hypothetical protein